MSMQQNETPRESAATEAQAFGTPPVTTSSAHSEPSLGSAAHAAEETVRDIAETAKEETTQVAREAGQHAQDMWRQTRDELAAQAGVQQERAATGLRSLSDELSAMAQSSEQGGVGSDLANQAAGISTRAADWLEQRQPGDLADEVTRFARNKPGTFLLAAAVLGVAGGRLMRGIGSGSDSSGSVTDIRDRSTNANQSTSIGTDGFMPPMGSDDSSWSDSPLSATGSTPFNEPAFPSTTPKHAAGLQ